MSKYYHLKVKEVIRETEDSVSIHFWHPWNEVIGYKPGQYLTILWNNPEGGQLRRSYSLSSSPYTDVSPAITVKKMDDGPVSNYLVNEVKEGDVLEVMQPTGTFYIEPDADVARSIFLLGTGSGITPLIAIAKTILIAEPESKVFLFYGNRRFEDIILRTTIERLEKKYPDQFQVVHSLTLPPIGWVGATGRLTESKLAELLQPFTDTIGQKSSLFFLCGQPDFMEGAKQILRKLGAAENTIRCENFFIGHGLENAETLPESNTVTLKSRTIKLLYEGDVHDLVVPPHQSVLEAALENDIDLPYSCQAGMCTACLGRLRKGDVTMDEYDALTDAEVREGFILTCVSHPLSDDVEIEVE